MQHRSRGVERDDGVVGQLLLAQAARFEESELDLEFRRSSGEGRRGRHVAESPEPVCLTQTHELVGCLRRTDIIESAQQRARIDCTDSEVVETVESLTDVGGA